MIRSAVGALIGAELDRHRGENGVRGAITGAIAAAALKRMGPAGLVIGGAWAAKQMLDRQRATREGPRAARKG